MTTRTGGQVLVDQLALHGVDTIFCVPGESYLPALDALYDTPQIRLITCRQEGGAAFAADAYGKLTGRPGVCFVTRGPGAANASIGLHTARQDSTPLILLVGQVALAHREREAFQEVDFCTMFAPLAKWVVEVTDPARLPELVARAFATAVSGRPGPVVLVLPEDVLFATCSVADARPAQRAQGAPSPAHLQQLHQMIEGATRPLLIVGGGDWSAQAAADISAFAQQNRLPVAAAFRAQDIVDNQLPVYIGDIGVAVNPALARRVRAADLVICVGDRLSEIVTSDYTLLDAPVPQMPFVHVFPAAEELGRVYHPSLAIASGMAEFAAAARALPPLDGGAWAGWLEQARAEYLAHLEAAPPPAALDMGAVMAHLRATLPADAILTNGAGSYTTWAHRYYQYRHYRTQLAPVNGAMGYGVPAALAASALHPDRTVVAFAGDGCFLMNGQELATAVQYGLKFIVLVINNQQLGTIRLHQERHYPGRVVGTDLVNPDFAAYARAFGCHGEVVERTAEFAPAFARALAAPGVALLELRVAGVNPRKS